MANKRVRSTENALLNILEDLREEKNKLEVSKQRLKSSIEGTGAGYFFVDTKGIFRKVNPAWLRMYKYKNEKEIIGNHFAVTQVDSDLEKAQEIVDGIIRKRKVVEGEFSRKCKDGSIGYHSYTISVVYENKKVIGIEGFLIDTTEKKLTENALRNILEDLNEEKVNVQERMRELRGIYETSRIMEEESMTKALPEIVKMIPYSYQFPGKACVRIEYNGKEYKTKNFKKTKWCQREEFKINSHVRGFIEVCYSENKAFFNEEVSMLKEVANQILQISERRRSKEELEASERVTRDILEGSPIPKFVIDKDHKIIFWNKSLEVLTGVSSKDMIGTTKQWSPFYPRQRPLIVDLIINSKESKIPILYKNKYAESKLIKGSFEAVDFFPELGKSGAWLHFTASPMRDSDGKIIGAIETLEDITEKKKAGDKLIESEKKYKTLSDNMEMGLILHGADTKILFSNPSAGSILGLTEDQMRGKDAIDSVWKFLREDGSVLPSEEYPVNKTISSKKPLQNYIIGVERLDRDYITWVIINSIPVLNKEKKLEYISITFQDITERKKAEDELIKNKDKLEESQKIGLIGTWSYDILNDNLEWTDQVYKIFGIKKGVIVKWDKFYKFIHPEDRKYISEEWTAATKGGVYDVEHRVVVGKEIKWVREKADIVFDEKGKAIFGIGIVQDITGKKNIEVELKKSKEELEIKVEERTSELQKANEELKEMDVIKTDFQNMISHELKTPLTAMLAHLEILEDKDFSSLPEEGAGVKKSLEAIKRNNNQLKILINNLLEVSRIQAKTFILDIEKVDAVKVAKEVIENLEAFAGQTKIKIIKRLSKIPKISVDKLRLVEIFNNLLSNAIKFTEKGSITVTCKKQGDFVSFSIIDTGIGIQKERIPRLFEKFYQVGESLGAKKWGSGLGLPITKQLLELQGGEIKVKSIFGKGSTFTFKLPIKYKKSDEYIALGSEAGESKESLKTGVKAITKQEIGKQDSTIKESVEETPVDTNIVTPLQKEGEMIEDLFSKVDRQNGSKSLKGGVTHVRKKIKEKGSKKSN